MSGVVRSLKLRLNPPYGVTFKSVKEPKKFLNYEYLISYLWYILATEMPLRAKENYQRKSNQDLFLFLLVWCVRSPLVDWRLSGGDFSRVDTGAARHRSPLSSWIPEHFHEAGHTTAEWRISESFVWKLTSVTKCSVLISAQRPSDDRHLSQNLDVLSQRAQKVTIL